MHNEIDLDKIDINLESPTEEPFRQYYFMARCREWVREFERKNGRRPTAFTQTFGCQMNAKDSEKLQGILERIGFVEADDEKADFVLYNTCTVRENANQRVYGRLGFLNTLKRKNPNMLIALCGCMMQEPDVVDKIKKSYGFVDIIFGTHNIFKLAELLFGRLEKKKMVVDIWKDTRQIVEELPAERKFSFKSGVNIMFGCDNFCSYCIVPYVRGRERSRKPEDIIAEVEKLAADGVTEVMLLGQNVNSYGKNLETPITFARLLRQVEEVEGIERIRFMTSHPKDLSQELIQVMGESKKICRHLHLGGMHIHIQVLRLYGQVEKHKGVFMLHHKGPVSFLNGLCHQIASDIAAIDVIVLKIPVAPGNYRFAREPCDPQDLTLIFHRQQVGGDLSPEHGVDNVL